MIDVDNTKPEDYHHDQEPDYDEYAHEYMKTEQFEKEFDEAFGRDDDQGYDEYKERRAGVFPWSK